MTDSKIEKSDYSAQYLTPNDFKMAVKSEVLSLFSKTSEQAEKNGNTSFYEKIEIFK